MTNQLRVAVVGVGYLGRFHALIYSRMPEVALVGVVDPDADRAHAVAAEVGCSAFTDAEELLRRVDAVSVVAPTSVHLEVAAPFLRRGVHMMLEKPIAATGEEGEEIVRLAARSGAILQIGHLERFNAGVMALARRISAPRYMEAQRMGGFTERVADVDVISDLMIHDIDIILALMGSPIRHIAAVGTPVLTEHIDIANARLEFADGAVASVVASRVSDKKMRRIRVFQPSGYLSLDFITQTIDIAYPKETRGVERPEIVRERIEIEPVKPLDRELETFVQCVRASRPPLVDGRVGLEALKVALEVRSGIRTNTGS
ncbi:Gfo/Idh/MocA family protein [Candidatus Thiosymbion oneisti]|uniref:Gfo/Idh/MocA family protein n=1 Tax=Candidatus Thiosymbion oneisti TaxID=589554 RepID=UPI000AEBBEC7|nr:Gfo/Idh/MocA family oxidoreductase [Candidatus Thiosymbion oneisti]